MRLLLIGCTGFIGQELVPLLLQAGHQVTLLSRKRHSKSVNTSQKNQLVHLQLDPSLRDSWSSQNLLSALKESEGVVNLAGEPIAEKRWTQKHLKELKKSRISTTSYLVEAMKKLSSPPQVLINASAIGYYGTSSNAIFDESSPSGKDFLATLCKEWEEEAIKKPNSTRLVVLRIGIVIDKDGGALKKMIPIFKAGFGGPIGSGNQWMSWIQRSDLCEIILKSLTIPKWNGVINAVAPETVSMKEFTSSLAKSLNRPNLLSIPSPLLRLILGDGAKVVLEGQNVNPKMLKDLEYNFKCPRLNQALEFTLRNSN